MCRSFRIHRLKAYRSELNKRAGLVSLKIISVIYTIIDLGIELTKQHLRILINQTSAAPELLLEESQVEKENEAPLKKKLIAQQFISQP
jgi:hypothetical protein